MHGSKNVNHMRCGCSGSHLLIRLFVYLLHRQFAALCRQVVGHWTFRVDGEFGVEGESHFWEIP